jgi:hypothetical protein
MRLLWTLIKFALVICVAVPLLFVTLNIALGLFGALVGLAFIVLRIALIALVGYGAIRLAMSLFGGGSRREAKAPEVKSLAPADPYYEAALRELDREVGGSSR